jgi:hypothetical protein
MRFSAREKPSVYLHFSASPAKIRIFSAFFTPFDLRYAIRLAIVPFGPGFFVDLLGETLAAGLDLFRDASKKSGG